MSRDRGLRASRRTLSSAGLAGITAALLLVVVPLVRAMPGTGPSWVVSLYDGGLGTGTPDTQGFTYLARPVSPPLLARQSFAEGVTTLTTTLQVADSAGYFARPEPLGTLDRDPGFSVHFTVQLKDEDHPLSDKNGDGVGDRAGFSIIVLSSDTRGIELGFWENEVWAQNDGSAEPPPNDNTLFTHGEGAAFDTSSGLTEYDLQIFGDTYALESGGNQILTGPLRDYRAFGQFPYILSNFMFLGDDTTSASATIRLSSVSLERIGGPGDSPSPTPGVSPTPTMCPVPTEPPLWVDPVISPTHQRSQTIHAQLTGAEWIEVTSLMGTFRSDGAESVAIAIPLAPARLNSLVVRGRVRRTQPCGYGGYEVVTTTDRQGHPLEILQLLPIYVPYARAPGR